MAKNNKKYHTKYTESVKIEEPIDFNTAECVELKLFGYRKKGTGPYTFKTTQEVDQIKIILVEEISGDEVITIYYKDDSTEHHDSSNCRIMNFHDGSYLCSTKEEIDRFILDHLYRK